MKRYSILALLSLALCMSTFADDAIKVKVAQGVLTVEPITDNAVRVKCSMGDMVSLEELIYTEKMKPVKCSVKENDAEIRMKMKEMQVVYNKGDKTLTFFDAKGKVVLRESAGSRGVKEGKVQDMKVYDVKQSFVSETDEHIYGTGQFQDGYLNIRGLTRRLTQVNTQIAIPFIMSSKGYGLLWNNYGMTEYNPSANIVSLNPSDEKGNVIEVDVTSTTGNKRESRVMDSFSADIKVDAEGDYAFLLDVGQAMARKLYLAVDNQVLIDLNNVWLPPTGSAIAHLKAGIHKVLVKGVDGDNPTVGWRFVDNKTTFRSPVATGLDYTVFVGNADKVVASYRKVTGEAPLMPEFMLGYVHCRERYNTQTELMDNAQTFNEKQIPMDVIVQDWLWWGKYGWNAMQWDEDKYPDPAKMMTDLHDMGYKFMISVWSKVDQDCALGKQLKERGYYVEGTDWIDFFNPEASKFYWQNFRDRMVRPYSVDGWWFDATEPENDDLLGRRINNHTLPGELYRNVYPSKVIATMYNGIKSEKPDAEPTILTRSAFSGMQRYGILVWSGDVGNDFDCLRRQIAGGLGYVATGMPWWTYDAGGFFRPANQYTNKAYQERMLRWIQTSVYLPVMRVHGYMSHTEPWRYDKETERIFVECIKERKAMLPYLKDCARRVAEEGYTIMRPLVFDFCNDSEALKQETEYMFGPKYLVCPVLSEGATTCRVYLPKNKRGWDDHYTHMHYNGGQYVDVPVTLEHIAVFERRQ